jgi:hypothetical protein
VSVTGSRAQPTFADCTFTDNAATGQGGAAVFALGASVSLTNCSFSRNTALSGAAVALQSAARASFTGCAFAGNTASPSATGDLGRGGVFAAQDASRVLLQQCRAWGNRADAGSVVALATGGNFTAVGSQLDGNVASTSADVGACSVSFLCPMFSTFA